MILAEDLHVERSSPGRGRVEALRGVTLRVGEGQMAVVLGRSGAGKTTLLETLTGLLPLSAGAVVGVMDGEGGGRSGRGRATASAGAPGVGLLFQHPERQLFGATALEDVAWGLGPEGRAAGRRALERAAVPEVLWEAPLSRLSRGELRRVALAGVLARRPMVLLLDEPAVGLDPAGQALLLAEVDAYRRESGAAVVVATHWPEPWLGRADTVLCLAGGAPLCVGPVEGLASSAAADPAVAELLPFVWRLRAALERGDPPWGGAARSWLAARGGKHCGGDDRSSAGGQSVRGGVSACAPPANVVS